MVGLAVIKTRDLVGTVICQPSSPLIEGAQLKTLVMMSTEHGDVFTHCTIL